jgi:hypothetical protein
MPLLALFDYDEKALVAAIAHNRTDCFKRAGLALALTPSRDTAFECPMCYSEVDYKQTLAATTCGHRFCLDCLRVALRIPC